MPSFLRAALLMAALPSASPAQAADDHSAVRRTIQHYFDGWATGDTVLLGRAMHASCHLKRSVDGKFVDMTREQYLAIQRPHARDSTLTTRVASVDIVGPIASARAHINIGQSTFVDYFNLLKTDEGWFIVDKVSTRVDRIPDAPTDVGSNRAAMPVEETVLDSLRRPWSMAFLSETEALISEKEGALLRVNLDTRTRTPIRGFPADLADSMPFFHPGDNSGRFDVVLDPDFSGNRLLYMTYVASNGRGRTLKLIRARLRGDSLVDIRPLFTAEPYSADRVHYGGGLVIGSDGLLYLTVGGRLFSEADEPALPISQDIRDRRGKIYRFNRDGSIPAGNPTFGTGSVPGLFALGIRASQGLAVHPVTREIWFSEHGTHQGDELNVLQPGANYGWPLRTTGRYRDTAFVPPAAQGPLTDPAWSWPHTVAPTGPVFYTGSEFPTWQNSFLVGGLSRGSLWRMTVNGHRVVAAEELLVDRRQRVRKVVQSPGGALYFLTDYMNGRLVRLRNAQR
ncbi:MAG: PQQ-dependent sugar dehydrogenase [Cytophagaceae bacterium]|nr:PQQ-dependent sugar dehydrogenase [Gemmatimonadaceae bacterium]